jgi:hypothetical protein
VTTSPFMRTGTRRDAHAGKAGITERPLDWQSEMSHHRRKDARAYQTVALHIITRAQMPTGWVTASTQSPSLTYLPVRMHEPAGRHRRCLACSGISRSDTSEPAASDSRLCGGVGSDRTGISVRHLLDQGYKIVGVDGHPPTPLRPSLLNGSLAAPSIYSGFGEGPPSPAHAYLPNARSHIRYRYATS